MKETTNIKQWLKDIVTTINELSAPYYHLTAKRSEDLAIIRIKKKIEKDKEKKDVTNDK